MPKFTKTQYEHFKRRFYRITDESAKKLNLDKDYDLSIEEKIGMIVNGQANLNLKKVFRPDGVCNYNINNVVSFYDFPDDDIRMAKKQEQDIKKYNIRKILSDYLEDLLDQYTVGLIEASELLSKIKLCESLSETELESFVDGLSK